MSGTVDVAAVILETVLPGAKVQVATVYFQTDVTAVGSAKVDVATVVFQTDFVAGGHATVDVADVYFAMRGSTANVEKWILDLGGWVPIIDRRILNKVGAWVD